MDRLKRAGLTLTEQALGSGETVYVLKGDTYPMRGELREMGGHWDAGHGAWIFKDQDPSPRLEALAESALAGGEKRPHYWGHRQRLRDSFMAAPEALPDYQLLELLLFFSIPRRDVKPDAKRLLAEFGSLAGVLAAEPDRLRSSAEVSHQTLVQLKAVREIARRLTRAEIETRPRLKSAKEVLDYCHLAMAREPVEQLRLLFLDARMRLLADEVQQVGTVDHLPAYPREIVKRALELGATGMILVHNHPAGDPSPSRADIEMTKAVALAAAPLGIALHDHLIVARDGHSSLRDLELI